MSKLSFFGHQGEIDDIHSFFQAENYIICRGAVDLGKIDDLVNFYNEAIVNSRRKYFRQANQWQPHDKTSANGIKNAFLNPHFFEQGDNGKFADKILSVLSAELIQESLRQISGKSVAFKLFQTMVFDHSTTRPHQDWIYLDSRPNGHLIAAWVALEDIPTDGIRFFVYPQTHHFAPKAAYKFDSATCITEVYEDFLSEIDQLLDSGQFEMYAPPLRKGDIFFWGSRIVHGSTPGTNPNLRRRSIAAHFVPDGFGFGDLQRELTVTFRQKYGLHYAYENFDQAFAKVNNPVRQSGVYQALTKSVVSSVNLLKRN